MQDSKVIYRVAVDGIHCRSSRELIKLTFAAVPGVEATSIDESGTLTVLADESLHSNDVVRALIDAGFTPAGSVSLAGVEIDAPKPVLEADEAEPVELRFEELVAEPVAAAEELLVEPSVEATVEAPARALAALNSEGAAAVAGSSSCCGSSQPLAAVVESPVEVEKREADEQSLEEALRAPAAEVSPRASLVQRIKVAVSDDYYPNRIDVIPGVPVEIEFSEGHGCLARVLFEDFGVEQDLTQGGGVVRLPGLAEGEYWFSCGMKMVFGKVVAKA